jgi:predicted DNA-binding transcriptional regulator AlpA
MLSKTSSPSGPPAHHASSVASDSLTPKQAARLLNLSVSWLAKRRLAGDGPLYSKLGGAVRYDEVTLRQWMASRRRTSTSGP